MSRGARVQTHAVIDGSNLATEGRKEPSLAQLDEAVRAITAEYHFSQITVIVDATFEHRVAKAEAKAARAAIDDNDIITPPAGVIGRGDAFILQVADRANAVVFSNDSFQEFHGSYDWLFDEGRLIGGKPVPGIGWIYVARSPVRGPVSRRATAEVRATERKPKGVAAATVKTERGTASHAGTTGRSAAGTRRAARTTTPTPTPTPQPVRAKKSGPSAPTAAKHEGSNDQATWRVFKADFPVGSTIAVQVDRFSSHGAYGSVDDVVIYLPNRLLGEPAPTKARDVLDLGATVDFVVHRYDDQRYGVDAGLIAVPGMRRESPRPAARAAAKSAPAATARTRRVGKKAAAATTKATTRTTAKKAATRTAAKKSAATTAKKATTRSAATRTAAKKVAAGSTVKKTAARTATKKTAVAPAKKTSTRTATKKTTAKKAAKRR